MAAATAITRKEQEEFASFLGHLNGTRFANCEPETCSSFSRNAEVRNGELIVYLYDKSRRDKGMDNPRGNITGYRFTHERQGTDPDCRPGQTIKTIYEFSRDGTTLKEEDECGSCGRACIPKTLIYQRE